MSFSLEEVTPKGNAWFRRTSAMRGRGAPSLLTAEALRREMLGSFSMNSAVAAHIWW